MTFRTSCKIGRRSLLLFAALLLVSNQTKAAEVYYVAPAPTGSDANTCATPSSACATFQHAVDLCGTGQKCDIVPAPGTYSQKTNVFYYKVITILGPQADNGKCADDAVIVDNRVNGIAERGPIFWIQDHSILTIKCLTLTSCGEGSLGIEARQFAIGDVVDIKFGKFISGVGVSATESSKINVLNPQINGRASRFAMATDLSQVTIGGVVELADNLTFEVAFVSAVFNSIVSVYPSSIIGGGAISGASYQCFNSIIKRDTALPGGDVPYAGSNNCQVFGLASDNAVVDLKPELKPVYSEFKAVRAEFQTNEAEFNHKIRATRIEGIMVASTLLVIAGIGAVFAWRQHRRQTRLEHILFNSKSPSE